MRNQFDEHAAWDGCLFETYGTEFDFVRKHPANHIWTLLDNGNGGVFIGSGFHYVNRIGYFISTVPIPPHHHYEVAIEEVQS